MKLRMPKAVEVPLVLFVGRTDHAGAPGPHVTAKDTLQERISERTCQCHKSWRPFARMNDDTLVLRFRDFGQSPNVRQ